MPMSFGPDRPVTPNSRANETTKLTLMAAVILGIVSLCRLPPLAVLETPCPHTSVAEVDQVIKKKMHDMTHAHIDILTHIVLDPIFRVNFTCSSEQTDWPT